MYLSMDINTTLLRRHLIESGFSEETTNKIMEICYGCEIVPDFWEEDD